MRSRRGAARAPEQVDEGQVEERAASGTSTTASPPPPQEQPPRSPAQEREDAAEHRPPSARLGAAVATTSRWTLRVLVIGVGLAVLVWALDLTWTITLPVLLALLLATVLVPPTDLLARAVPRALAALLVVAGALALVAVGARLLVPTVREQSGDLFTQAIAAIDRVQALLAEVDGGSPAVTTVVDQALERLQDNATLIATRIATALVDGVVSIASLVVTALLTVVLAFFITKDAPRFLPWAHRWLGNRAAGHVDALGGRVWKTLGGFIAAQAAVSFVDAVFIGAGLWFLDVPFALVLSVLIFFAGFIPIVGAVSTGILAVLVALISQGPWPAVAVLGIVLAVQQLESNLLQPVLVGRILALHPVVVLAAVTVGSTLFGIVGAFLAVPVVSVAVVVARYSRQVILTGGIPADEEAGDHGTAADQERQVPAEAARTS